MYGTWGLLGLLPKLVKKAPSTHKEQGVLLMHVAKKPWYNGMQRSNGASAMHQCDIVPSHTAMSISLSLAYLYFAFLHVQCYQVDSFLHRSLRVVTGHGVAVRG